MELTLELVDVRIIELDSIVERVVIRVVASVVRTVEIRVVVRALPSVVRAVELWAVVRILNPPMDIALAVGDRDVVGIIDRSGANPKPADVERSCSLV